VTAGSFTAWDGTAYTKETPPAITAATSISISVT